jgi:nucleolar protein 56
MSQLYLLFESSSGYCLFEKEEFDPTGGQLSKIQKAIMDIERFSKMVKLAAYQPFTTAEEALENITAVAHNNVTDTLKKFLTTHLPSTKKAKS